MTAKERATYADARNLFQPGKANTWIYSSPNPETIRGLRRIGCTKRAALIIAAAFAAMDADQANADHVARFINTP